MFSSSTLRFASPFLVTAMIALASEDASAADANRDRAKIHAAKATKSFKAGKYELALREFTRASKLFPAPAFLFNIAQCHIFLGRHDRAISFLERYLEEAPDSAHRTDVLALIEESRREIEKKKAKQRPEKSGPKVEVAERVPEDDPGSGAEEERAEAEPPSHTGTSEDAAAPGEPSPPPTDTSVRAVDLSPAQPPDFSKREIATVASEEDEQDPPLLGSWWFWTILGSVAVAAGGTAIALSAGGETRTILPSGSLGVADRRTP